MYDTIWKNSIEQFEDNMRRWMHDSTGTYDPGHEMAWFPYEFNKPNPYNVVPAPSQHFGFSPSDMHTFQTTPRTENPGFHNAAQTVHDKQDKGQEHKFRGPWKGWQRGPRGGGQKAKFSVGGIPKLGNVPFSTQSSSSSGSPIVLILVLGGGVLAIYFIWHKLRKSKAEDKEMDKKGE